VLLAKGTTTNNYELIVVDDASPDFDEGSRLSIQRLRGRLIRQPTRTGPSGARNVGASAATGEWLWFLDSDVVLFPNSVRKMQELIDRSEWVGAIVSGISPTPLFKNPFQKFKNYFDYSIQPPEGRTYTVDSKSFAIRRDLFLRSGGFDCRYRLPNVEDYELGYRLLRHKVQIYFTREVVISHHHSGFFRQFQLNFQRAKGWMGLKRQYGLFFDDFGTTRQQAAAQISGISIVLALVTFPRALLFLLPVWCALNFRVLQLLYRRGEPALFFLTYLCFYCAQSLPICSGAGIGLFHFLRSRKCV